MLHRRSLLTGLFIAPAIIPRTNLMKLSWRSSQLLGESRRIFLYDINSCRDCQERTGKFATNGDLMRDNADLSKQDFCPTSDPFNGQSWHIELVDTYELSNNPLSASLSPFDIYIYYNSSGSYASPIKVYAVLDG